MNTMIKNSRFPKTERLCNKSIIDKLYASNNHLTSFPLSVRWMIMPESSTPSAIQILMVAPKRKLHHAVDRNRTKRIMRECFRTRKNILIETLSEKKLQLALSFNYMDNATPDFNKLGQRFDKIINTLNNEIQSYNNENNTETLQHCD